MTVIEQARPQAVLSPERPPPPRARLIAIAVGDEHDLATIDWALADSVPADALHIVHAYTPLRLDGCAWRPVVRARDARYHAARRVVAQAVQRVSAQRPVRTSGGSAIAGKPDDVLVEMSEVVDLVVVGGDMSKPSSARLTNWSVQDRARCPVVVVPAGTRTADRRPVVVVADEQGLSPAAVRFGVETALRHGVGLEVSRAWSSLHLEPTPLSAEWLAEQQAELDAALVGWQERYPLLPITARIELDDAWLPRLRRASSLLAVPQRAARLLRVGADGPTPPCPVAVVPEDAP